MLYCTYYEWRQMEVGKDTGYASDSRKSPPEQDCQPIVCSNLAYLSVLWSFRLRTDVKCGPDSIDLPNRNKYSGSTGTSVKSVVIAWYWLG